MFQKKSIRFILGLCGGIIGLLVIGQVYISISNLTVMNAKLERMKQVDDAKMRLSEALRHEFVGSCKAMSSILASTDQSEKTRLKSEIEKNDAIAVETLEKLSALEINDEGKRLLAQTRTAVMATQANQGKLLPMVIGCGTETCLRTSLIAIREFQVKGYAITDSLVNGTRAEYFTD